MPFEVFRRHQKKWLAALALLAMIAFTLDLGLFRNRGPARGNPVIFKADGRDVHDDEVTALKIDRLRANQFVAATGQVRTDSFFGGISDEEMVNAYLLDREAKRLNLPANAELGAGWLRQTLRLPTDQFDQIYRQLFADAQGEMRCTDTQLLESIARQLRIVSVQILPDTLADLDRDSYLSTPLDYYAEFRDQAERVAAKAVAFPALDYIDKVGEPTDDQLRTFFGENKDRLPDPDSDLPGFKVPRQVRVEYVSADAAQIEEDIRAKLTDEELRAYYNANVIRFPAPPNELPANVFAGDPEAKLTPRTTEPFHQVREEVKLSLAGERARDEIERLFNEVRRDVMDPFLDRYDMAREANREAKEAGQPETPLPTPNGPDGASPLKAAAERLGFQYELTPDLDQTSAELIMPIARAAYGSGVASRRIPFAAYIFARGANLYESFELTDPFGQRYLGWKVADDPDRVPTLDEARPKVIEAWKLAQARELARKDADALADQARLKGGDLAGVAGSRPIITTSEQPRILRIPALAQLNMPTTRPSEIPELPRASEALRDALFSLEPGQIRVEPNAPKTVYYVMALDRRSPADLRDLFGPTGARYGIANEIDQLRTGERMRAKLESLRAAGAVKMEIPARPGAEAPDTL